MTQRALSASVLRRCPRGATTVEAAVLLPILLVTLFGFLDLSLAVFRYTVLVDTSRNLARQATVRGAKSAGEFAPWGPDAYTGAADDGTEMAQTAAKMLPTMPPQDVALQISWPDDDNQPDSRVQVHITYIHEPLMPLLTLGKSLTLSAHSEMRIVH